MLQALKILPSTCTEKLLLHVFALSRVIYIELIATEVCVSFINISSVFSLL